MDSIVIIGAGTMGRSIAQFFLQNNVSVSLIDQSQTVLHNAKGSIRDKLEDLHEKAVVKDKPQHYLAHLQCLDSIPNQIDASIIIEAIPEKLSWKQSLFEKLEQSCDADTIFATNTSGLSITEIGSGLQHPSRLIGTHFFTPAAIVPLVEVVKGEMTSEATADRIMDLLHSLGKKPVLLKKEVPGFIGNRIQHAISRETLSLIENEVATAEEIDTVVRWSIGLRMILTGPVEQRDVNGLDIHYDIASYLYKDLNNSETPSPLLKQKVEKGETGMKAGKGFYDWEKQDDASYLQQKEDQLINLVQFLRGE